MSTPPLDAQGKPLAQVSGTVAEKIGLPNYSNVDIGPITVTRWVLDTPEARLDGIRECMAEAEEVAKIERGLFLQRLGHAMNK